MWIIIFLELITFGMALVAFALYGSEEPELFHQSRLQLNSTFGAINTVFLLTSGFFMASAVHEFKENNIKKSSLYFKLTMLGGLLFLLLKSVEYYHKIESGITLDTNAFFAFYWLLTGFHLIHVIMGLVILIWTNNGMMKKTLLFSYGLLILLTVVTALISNFVSTASLVVGLVMGLSILKFILVSFEFMELKKANSFWKISVISVLLFHSYS